MKTLDKKIINISVILLLLVFTASLVFYFSTTLKIISVIGAIAYMLFIIFHLALCAPLFVICFWTSDKINSFKCIEGLKDKSDIIYSIVIFISCSISCFAVYILTPIILAMIFNNNLNLDSALELVQKTIK